MIDEFMIDEIKPKKDSMVDRDLETEIFKRIVKSTFLEELEKLNVDLTVVSNGRRNKNEQFHNFNIFVKNMHTVRKISMQDIASFLEEDFFDTKTVLNCLNEENLYILREEMAKRYNIKQTKSRLSLIIE